MSIKVSVKVPNLKSKVKNISQIKHNITSSLVDYILFEDNNQSKVF